MTVVVSEILTPVEKHGLRMTAVELVRDLHIPTNRGFKVTIFFYFLQYYWTE
jgi:hypothetical protein